MSSFETFCVAITHLPSFVILAKPKQIPGYSCVSHCCDNIICASYGKLWASPAYRIPLLSGTCEDFLIDWLLERINNCAVTFFTSWFLSSSEVQFCRWKNAVTLDSRQLVATFPEMCSKYSNVLAYWRVYLCWSWRARTAFLTPFLSKPLTFDRTKVVACFSLAILKQGSLGSGISSATLLFNVF